MVKGEAMNAPGISPEVDENNEIPPELLVPFEKGWKQEVVYRHTKHTHMCDVYYIPPKPTEPMASPKGSQRKRRWSKDLGDYFDKFPDENLF